MVRRSTRRGKDDSEDEEGVSVASNPTPTKTPVKKTKATPKRSAKKGRTPKKQEEPPEEAAVAEEQQEQEEEAQELLSPAATPSKGRRRTPASSRKKATPSKPDEDLGEPEPLSEPQIQAMKVKDLQSHLKTRGLNTKGKKAELVQRLLEACTAEPQQEEEEEQAEPEQQEQAEPEHQEQAEPEQQETEAEEQPQQEEKAEEREVKAEQQQEQAEKAEEQEVKAEEEQEQEEQAEELQQEQEEDAVMEDVEPALEEEYVMVPSDVPSEPNAEMQTDEQTAAGKRTAEEAGFRALTDEEQKERARSPKRLKTSADDEQQEADEGVEVKVSDSRALRIDGFVRPLRNDEVTALLEQFGDINFLWMDKIKTHAYVVFASIDSATRALTAIDGLDFQPVGGKKLRARSVPESEAEAHDGSMEMRPRLSPPRSDSAAETSVIADAVAVPPVNDTKSIDELFCKTKALPHLYYQPLSSQEVKRKFGSR